MTEERIKTDTESYNGHSENEKIRKVLIWSDYTPEIALMVHSPHGARKGVLTPLPKNLWIEQVAEVAKVKAENQFSAGEKTQYFSPQPDKEANIKLLPDLEEATATLFKSGPNFTDYYEYGLALVEGSYGEPAADVMAREYFEIFARRQDFENNEIYSVEPQGKITIERHFGVNVFIVENKEDMQALKPYSWLELEIPDASQAFSFVMTKRSIPFIKDSDESKELEDSLWVVSRQSCDPIIVEQHIRTQAIHRLAMEGRRRKTTPVLVSPPKPTQLADRQQDIEKALDERVKLYSLRLLAADPDADPYRWIPVHEKNKQAISNALKTLFNKHSKIDMRPWIGGVGRKSSENIENIQDSFKEKMKNAFEVINNMANVKFVGVKEWQLVVANILSFYPLAEWSNVYEQFTEWERQNKSKFKRSTGLQRQPLKEI